MTSLENGSYVEREHSRRRAYEARRGV